MDAVEVPPLMDGPGCRGWGPAGLCSGREPCCAGILDGDDRSFPADGASRAQWALRSQAERGGSHHRSLHRRSQRPSAGGMVE